MTETDTAGQVEGSWREILTGRAGLTTFVLSLGMILYAVNHFVVATIMPTIVTDISGVEYYTWAFSLFAMGAIIGSAGASAVRDAFGPARAYAGAGLLLAIGLVGAALAGDMPTMVAWRLIQGIGGGAVASQSYGLAATAYPPHLRSRVLGVISTVWGIATLGGPGFGAAFAEFGMWRGAFWTLVPLTIIFAGLAWRLVEGGAGHGRLSEIPYLRLALLGLAVLVLSATSLTEENWLRGVLIIASLAFAALTFVLDARAEHNMFPRGVTSVVSDLGVLCWILFLISIVLTFVGTYTTFYLQTLHGITPFTAGYLFATQSVMWTVGALMVATISRSREPESILAGIFLVLLCCIAIALTVDRGPLMVIAIAIALSGIGLGLLNNPVIQRMMATVPASDSHVIGHSVQTIRNMGIAFGAAASGMIASIAGLTEGVGVEVIAASMRWVYGINVVFAALALVMVIPLLIRHRGRQDG